MHRFANPARFLKLANAVLPWSAAATVLLFAAGLYLALLGSPPDYQQGESVRIMYVHVPAAWMAVFVYLCMAAASASALIWRHPLADLIAKSAAPIGAGFTLICLATGSLWGKPMWGTWWAWDPRMTSVLVLFFFYLGYIALVNAFDDPSRGYRAASILALVGVVNLPIVKFSVDWWDSLHQAASVVRLDGPAIHASMLWPLLLMAAGFKLFFMTVLILRVRSEIAAAKVRNLQLSLVQG
jgi:heme exporter protein C